MGNRTQSNRTQRFCYIRGVKQNGHVPPVGSWANSPLGIRDAKTCIKQTQKGGVHHFQGIIEVGSRSRWRQTNSTHQSAAPRPSDLPWHRPPETLPCWTLPCCPPGSRGPSLKDADNSLAHRAVSRTCRLGLWDSGSLFPTDCCVCVCVLYFS